MSMLPYNPNQSAITPWTPSLSSELLFRAHYIYVWLRDVAPVVVTYRLKQLGRDGVDRLPLLSWEVKQEIKRWLRTQGIL